MPGVDAAVDPVELVDQEVGVAQAQLLDEALLARAARRPRPRVTRNASIAESSWSPALRRSCGSLRSSAPVSSRNHDPLARVGQRGLEAVPGEQAARLSSESGRHGRSPRSSSHSILRAAGLVLAVDREGVGRAVGERADLEQRVEPIALQHHAPVDGLLAEVVGPGLERLLPAGGEQLVDLAARLRERAGRRGPAPRGPSCRGCGH